MLVTDENVACSDYSWIMVNYESSLKDYYILISSSLIFCACSLSKEDSLSI